MTVAQALSFLKRRLGLEDMTQDTSFQDAELYGWLTFGRDRVKQALAMLPDPMPVKTTVSLEVDASDDTIYSFPDGTNDPYRVLEVREVDTLYPLVPGVDENDTGDYYWRSDRELRIDDDVSPDGGIEVEAVLVDDPIDEKGGDDSSEIPGLSAPAHRAVVFMAEFLALTVNDEGAGQAALQLVEREIADLERLYGEFDGQGGQALREALLGNYGRWQADAIP